MNAVFCVSKKWDPYRINAHQDAINFAQEEGIRKDIELYQVHRGELDGNLTLAVGNNSIFQSQIAIILDYEFLI